MLKPENMAKIRIMAHRSNYDALLSALQDAGVMQVEPISEKLYSSLDQGVKIDYTKISDAAQRFRSLESLLVPRQSNKLFSFDSIDELLAKADSVKIDRRVAEIKRELDSLSADAKYSSFLISLLERLQGFRHDLSILDTNHVTSFAVHGKDIVKAESALEQNMKDAAIEKLNGMIVVSLQRDDAKLLGSTLERINVSVEAIPQLSGTVAENLKKEKAKMRICAEKQTSLQKELEHISEAHYPSVSAIREQLDIEMEKIDVSNKFGSTTSTIVLEGWVPMSELKNVEKLIDRITSGAYILQHVRTNELPPTKLHNPIGFRLFEKFIRFYSLPKSTEVDPTLIFALVFPVFFGLMVGDAGYGALILLLALWILYRGDHIPRKSHIPKAVSSFLLNISSLNGLRVLAKSLIPGSLIAIALGVAFNEYFGFQLQYTALFNVQQNITQLLVIAGWIGVGMVGLGFVIGIFDGLIARNKRHAIAKLGWLIAMIGIVMFGLGVLHKADLSLDNAYAIVSYAAMLIGIGMIVAFEGARGFVELPSLISHILSYTRLVGILLASVILAEVIDFIFVAGLGKGLLFGILGVIILVIGQAFNIVIALFEPGIQGARLIYVEFFSKFYEGNGREFKPFSSKRRRTLSKFELE